MKKKIKTWNKPEWESFLPQLEKLSRDQLAQLTKAVGIVFYAKGQEITKEEYLLVLDESDPAELKRQYRRLVKKSQNAVDNLLLTTNPNSRRLN